MSYARRAPAESHRDRWAKHIMCDRQAGHAVALTEVLMVSAGSTYEPDFTDVEILSVLPGTADKIGPLCVSPAASLRSHHGAWVICVGPPNALYIGLETAPPMALESASDAHLPPFG